MENYLRQQGVPEKFLESSWESLEEREQGIRKKIKNAYKIMKSSGRNVMVIVGVDSPLKDEVIVCILKDVYRAGKTSLYYASMPEEGFDNAYMTAYTALHLMTGYHTHKAVTHIRSRSENDKLSVISVPSTERLEESLGADFMDFISHVAVIVEVNSGRSPMPKVG